MLNIAKVVPTKKGLFLRIIALILVGTFVLQEVAYTGTLESIANPISPLQKVMQDPYRLEISPDFASLKEIYKGSSDRLIIHIQDAHSNLSGQDNLAKTLDGIMTKYGVSLILVEGGAIDGTLDLLKDIVSPEATRRAARSLLIEGQITGEEYLNLISDHRMKIVGIEDMPLYFESVENYAKLAGQREATLRYLQIIQNAVDKLKNKLYPQKLLDYEKIDAQKFEERFSRLLEQREPVGFPDIQRLKELQDREKAIDLDLVNLEQAALIEELQARGASQEILELLARSSRFKDKKISQFTHFQKLFEIAEEKNVQLSQYPGLSAMMGYLKDLSELSLESVLEEWASFEDETYVSLLAEENQRLVRSIDRYLGLLKTAYHIQMSSKEFMFFKANEKDFATLSYLAFINRKLMDLGYFEDLVPYEDRLEEGGEALEAFYGSVSRRDEAFVKNAERIMNEQGQKAAILIAGGYHTQHLAELFGDEHHSLSVIAPNVTGETDQNRYEKLLLSSTVRYTQAPYHDIARLFAQKTGISAADPRITEVQVRFNGLIAGKSAGARMALEKIKDDEHAVSKLGLEGFILNPNKNAKRLNDRLSDPYSATQGRKKLQDVTFILRETGGKVVWAFPKTDLGKVKDLLGVNVVVQSLDKPKAGEYAVSQQGLWKIVTNPTVFARSLNAMLGDPTSATQITKELQGTVFMLRRNRTNVIWSFRKAQLASVRELINTRRLEQIKDGEYAVSRAGLKPLHLKNTLQTTKQLNDRLGDPESSSETEKKIKGVPFILRQSGSNIVWSIQKADFSRIQELLGIQSLEKLREDEHAVSQPGLEQFFINPTKTAKQLNGTLGNPETISETVKQLQGMIFTRRMTGSKVVWSFLKMDLARVQALLGNGMVAEGFEELEADEYPVTWRGLSQVFSNPRHVAEMLNSDRMLGNPGRSTELTKNLQGIVFTRRKSGTQIVWVFKKADLAKVSSLVGTPLQTSELQPDEMAFLPSSNLTDLLEGGLKASIKAASWPDYIEDPNVSDKDEIEVDHNGVKITFYRRLQNRGFIWAFKVQDLPNVAQIQGARAAVFKLLGADEYPVSVEGLSGLLINHPKLVQRLKGHLGATDSGPGTKILGAVTFTLRKNWSSTLWSFKKKDLEKVRAFLGVEGLKDLNANDHAITSTGLHGLVINAGKSANHLNKLLGNPTDSKNVSKIVEGISFARRKNKTRIVWSFDKKDLSRVRTLLGEEGGAADLEVLKANETAVSRTGLAALLLNGVQSSAPLNEALGDPWESAQLTKVVGGVTFTRRRKGPQRVWAYAKKDFEKVRQFLGAEKSMRGLERLKQDEYPVSAMGLKGVFPNHQRRSTRLIELLGDPAKYRYTSKKLNGITFSRRRGSSIVWSFSKADVGKVGDLLGVKEGLEALKEIQDDEYLVSGSNLGNFLAQPSAHAKRLNGLLGGTDDLEQTTKLLGGVVFTLRKANSVAFWSFKKRDAKKVAEVLGTTVKSAILDLQPDEMAFIPAADADMMISKGLNASLKSATWPDYVENPNISKKTELEVERNGVKVVFNRRRQNGGYVWAFKIGDLPKVAQIQGARLVVEKLKAGEYVVSTTGLRGVLLNSLKYAKRLSGLLNSPKNIGKTEVTLGGVTFTRRRKGPGIVWSFEKKDLEKVETMLGVVGRIEGLEELKENEYAVNQTSFNGVLTSRSGADRLKKLLGDPDHSSDSTKILGKVTFLRRMSAGFPTWAFQKTDLDKIKQMLGVIEPLKDDEYAVSGKGFKGVLLHPAKPAIRLNEILGDPQEIQEISKTLEGVVFTVRRNRNRRVWSLAKKDLESVKAILGIEGSAADLEGLRENEYGVSKSDLASLSNPLKVANQLNQLLGDPENSSELTQVLGDVTFTRRKSGPVTVWSFPKEDLEKVKFFMGLQGSEQPKEDEYAASYPGLEGHVVGPKRVADRLRRLLGAPESSDALTKTLGGVLFTRRKNVSEFVWAFPKDRLAELKAFLGIQGSVEGLEELKEDERAVSIEGLEDLMGDSPRLAKRLNDILGDPATSDRSTTMSGDVTFTRRWRGSKIVWSFPKAELEKVKALLGIEGLEDLKENEYAVSIKGLRGVLLGYDENSQRLNKLLGDPKRYSAPTQIFSGITFTVRKHGPKNVWSFAKEDLDKLRAHFGIKTPEEIEELKEDEFAVSQPALQGLLLHSVKAARDLNGLLGDPQSSEDPSKSLSEVVFTLRKSGNNIVWSFKKNDLVKVARILGIETMSPVLVLQPDEMAFLPGSDLTDLLEGGLKASLKTAAWPDYLEDPNVSDKDEILVERNRVKVTFYRRKQNGGFVWAFKAEDLPKVAQLQGARLAVENLKDTEYGVSNSSLTGVLSNGQVVAKRLNDLLGDPATTEELTKTLGGVIFALRKRESQTIWSFPKQHLQKIKNLLEIKRNLEGLEELKDTEYGISTPSLNGILSNSKPAAKRLNELVGDPATTKELTKTLGGILFTRRMRQSGHIIWSFTKQDLPKLIQRFGFKPANGILELQPDEMAFLPSPDLNDVLSDGLKASIKAAIWPDYIEDPNASDKTEILVDRNNTQVTFRKRRQNGSLVWAFKTEDLPKVSQIQGARLSSSTALVYQKLEAVYAVLSKMNPGQTLLIGDVSGIMETGGILPAGFVLPDGHTLDQPLVIASNKDISTANLYLMTFERREDRRIHLVFQVTEKNKTQSDLFFYWDEQKEQLVSLGTREEQKQRDEEVKRMIEGEISILFEENAILFTQRYLKDIKNILWGILGGKLEGKYDQRKIEELIDAKIVEMIEGVTGRKPALQDVVADAQEPSHAEPKVFVQSPVMTQTQIISLAQRLSMRINEDIIDEGQRAVASQQAKSFLKKLEELYFFRTYYSENPDSFRGDEAKVSIEAVLHQEQVPPLVQEILRELLSEIAQSAELENVLHEKGLRSTTRLGLYQLVAIDRMAKNKKMILADEMGLGKTLETIGTFLLSGENEMVVIGPKNALDRWMDDLGEHTDTDMEVYLLGDKAPSQKLQNNKKVDIKEIKDPIERNEFLLSPRPDHGKRRVVLLNYELMPNLLKYKEKEGRAPPSVSFLALDEVHKIKNRNTQTSRAIFGDKDSKGAFQADHKILISGTPLENDTIELLGYLKYISLGGQTAEERFFETVEPSQFAQIYSKLDLARLSQLHAYLTMRMIRRLKDDVLKGLPKKSFLTASLDPLNGTMTINGDVPVQLSGNYRKQSELYEQALENPAEFERQRVDMLPEPEDDEEENDDSARTTQLLRLEQVTLNPGIFQEEGDSIKFDAVRHLVQERMKQGKSVLIFTNYKSAAKSLKARLDAEFGPDQVAYVDGSIKDKKSSPDRQAQIERFQDKRSPLMVATLGTMEVAVELTQADTIIFLNSPWKHSSLSQAIDRAHRYDSQGRNFEGKILEIVHLEFQHPVSIDELKAAVVRRKAILAEMLINGNLAPEVLAAFQEADKNILDAVRNADQSQETLTQYELSLMQQFRMLIGRILSTQDPELKKQLWAEAAEFYLAVLEHKSSFYANMASLDYLSSDKFPQLKGRKLRVLDLASGPSTLFRAYERKRAQFEGERRFSLQITDYDLTPQMLGLGVAREEGSQVLGALEDVNLAFAPGSFNLINLSYAFRYASHPAKLVRDVHQLLTEGDMFVVILPKTNRIPKHFFQSMREAGFDMVVGEGGKLQTRLEEEVYKKIFLQYGKEFADDVASETRADFSYFVAKKSTRAPIGGLDDEDFRFTRQVPPMTEEKLKKLKASGKVKIIPDNITVKGKVFRFDNLIDADGQEFLSMDARKLVSRISRISMLADQQAAIRGDERRADDKRMAIDRTIQRKLDQLDEHLKAALSTLENDDKVKLVGDIEALKTRNMVRQSFRGDRSNKVDAMIDLLGARLAIEKLKENEYAVSPLGLREVYLNPAAVSKMINRRLNRLARQKLQVELQEGSDRVLFSRRMTHSHRIWSFPRADAAKVASIFGFEDLGEDEYAVSGTGLAGLYTDPFRVAQRINAEVGDPETSERIHQTLGKGAHRVDFIRRKFGIRTLWAFKKADAPKLEKYFGIHAAVDDVGEDEYAISTRGLDGVYSNFTAASKKINSRLGSPDRSKGPGKMADGIAFLKKMMGPTVVWTFKKIDADKVAEAFGIERLESLHEDDVAVSVHGLKGVLTDKTNTAQKINEALGDPHTFLGLTTTYGRDAKQVTFTRRRIAKITLWSFDRKDTDNVAELFNVQKMEKLGKDDYAVTANGLNGLYIGFKRIVIQINQALGDPRDSTESTKTLGHGKERVIFTRRWNASHALWSFKKSEVAKVGRLFGVDGLQNLKDDEYAVSAGGLKDIYKNALVGAKRANDALGDPERSTVLERVFGDGTGEVYFRIRKSGSAKVWAFEKKDIDRVVVLFGLSLKLGPAESAPALASDEMSLMPSPDLGNILSGRLRSSLKQIIWPEYLEDPATSSQSQITVTRNDFTVIFYRRSNNGIPIWAFKIQDLQNVSKISGARLAEMSNETQSILRINQAPYFPDVVVTKMPTFSSLPLVTSNGILPIAVSSVQMAVFRSTVIDGARSFQLVRPEGRFSPIVGEEIRFTREEMRQAAQGHLGIPMEVAVERSESPSIDPQLQMALDSHKMKDVVNRQSLRRLVQNLVHDEHVELFLSSQDQDEKEMLRQLKELESEVERLNAKGRHRLYIYPRFVDENGKEVVIQSFIPRHIASGIKPKRAYLGILDQRLLDNAIRSTASYLPIEAFSTETGEVRALPYKQSLRALIVSTLSETLAVHMLQSLFAVGADIDNTSVKIIREPYRVPGITIDIYKQKGLIVLGARLAAELYQSYISAIAVGSSA